MSQLLPYCAFSIARPTFCEVPQIIRTINLRALNFCEAHEKLRKFANSRSPCGSVKVGDYGS